MGKTLENIANEDKSPDIPIAYGVGC